jgi:D-arginine dehydrogenase
MLLDSQSEGSMEQRGTMQEFETLVVGGGVAGAALVYHLAAAAGGGAAGVRLVERAPRPGAHASGRNARLVLQSVAEPLVRSLTAASAAAYAERTEEVGFERTGSLLLGDEAAFAARADPAIESRVVGASEIRRSVPLVAAADFAAALSTPGDGVLDPHRLLAFYLDGARRGGAVVSFDVEVTAIDGDGPFHVRTTAGDIVAQRLVTAAGPWAAELACCAGATPLPLVAYKRHLFVHRASLPMDHPYVWHLVRDVYFRPDPEGVLTCFCDEEPTADLAETVMAGAEDLLRERLRPLAPALADAPITRAWSCFRTKAPDALPVIGPDPRVPALWWLAGLGGYGLGASWELGRLAAKALREGTSVLPPEVSPARL